MENIRDTKSIGMLDILAQEVGGFENINFEQCFNNYKNDIKYHTEMYEKFEELEGEFPEIRGRHYVLKYTNCIFCYSNLGSKKVLTIYYNHTNKSALIEALHEMAESGFYKEPTLDSTKEFKVAEKVYNRIMA